MRQHYHINAEIIFDEMLSDEFLAMDERRKWRILECMVVIARKPESPKVRCNLNTYYKTNQRGLLVNKLVREFNDFIENVFAGNKRYMFDWTIIHDPFAGPSGDWVLYMWYPNQATFLDERNAL